MKLGDVNILLDENPYPTCRKNRDSCKAEIKAWKDNVLVRADALLSKGVKPIKIKVTDWDEIGNNYFITAEAVGEKGSEPVKLSIKTEVETGMLDDEKYSLLGGDPGVYVPGQPQPLVGYKNMFAHNSTYDDFFNRFEIAYLGGTVRIDK